MIGLSNGCRTATRMLLQVAALGLAASMWGCAGEQVSRGSAASDLAGKGVAIVSVTHNASIGGRVEAIFYVDSSRLSEQRLLRSVEHVLGVPVRSDFADLYGQVYVLALPPGTHRIEGWRVSAGPSYLAPPSALPPLEFTLQPGEVVYLGNLHMNLRMGGGRPVDAVPQVRDRRELDLAVAATKAPAIKGHVEPRLLPLGAWQ